MWVALLVAPAFAENPVVNLEKGENGIQIIDADFLEEVSPETAWAVLTDYAGIPTFVTSMKSSRVLARSGADVIVEQLAVGHFLWVSKTLDVLLKIKEQPLSSISFEDIRLKDFDFYRGEWTLFQETDGIRIRYTLSMKAHVEPPAFMRNQAIKKNVTELLEQIQAEMYRRSKEEKP